MSDAVLYEVADSIATVTLNRPERMNAWSADIDRGMSTALATARDDDAVRAIIVTGAGRAFCAGADLGGGADTFAGREEPSAGEREGLAPRMEEPGDNVQQLLPYHVPKPVIAAINGPAVGIGMTYPMLCDVRVAADTAKLGFVFTRRGMMPELAAHTIVQRVAGFSNAAHLLMSGRIFTGAEAAELGIVTKAVPKDELLQTARAMAGEYRLAAPVSVAITKRLLWEGMHTGIADMMQREDEVFSWVGNQADAREGILSFLEKRDPEWQLSAARDLPDGFA